MREHKSGDEIERVFKVRQVQYPSEQIIQGYLVIDDAGSKLHKAARLTGVMEPSYAVREQGGAVLLRILAESNLSAGVTADVA
jgi:uncharacterized membrane-anchored protein